MTLATYLSERGLTDAAFAERIGVAHTTINRAKRGLLDLRVEVALKIEAETGGAVSAASLSTDVAKARALCTGVRLPAVSGAGAEGVSVPAAQGAAQ